jgi:hypothetical protein
MIPIFIPADSQRQSFKHAAGGVADSAPSTRCQLMRQENPTWKMQPQSVGHADIVGLRCGSREGGRSSLVVRTSTMTMTMKDEYDDVGSKT